MISNQWILGIRQAYKNLGKEVIPDNHGIEKFVWKKVLCAFYEDYEYELFTTSTVLIAFDHVSFDYLWGAAPELSEDKCPD